MAGKVDFLKIKKWRENLCEKSGKIWEKWREKLAGKNSGKNSGKKLWEKIAGRFYMKKINGTF
jgi:hypothetical protein